MRALKVGFSLTPTVCAFPLMVALLEHTIVVQILMFGLVLDWGPEEDQ